MKDIKIKQLRYSLLAGVLLVIASCAYIKVKSNSGQKQNIVSKEIKAEKKTEEKAIQFKKEFLAISTVENLNRLPHANHHKFCKKVDGSFRRWGWGKSHCSDQHWFSSKVSHQKSPLVYGVWGNQNLIKKAKSEDVTLIMCGVHGDEITPIKFCFDVIEYLNEVASNKAKDKEIFEDSLVIVAPIVNPDSYFKRRPTRTNYHGVDINRNFPTKDWNKDALRLWKSRYRRDKRRYPGKHANSEPEVEFQVSLIKKFHPSKIISVHAPLTMLDYDGPDAFHTGGLVGTKANQLLIQMSKKAKGYRIKNYPFFPGSLGNYAGNERDIPTFTLELPSSDNRKHKKYWAMFKGAIREAILKNIKPVKGIAKKEGIPSETIRSN